MSNEAAVFYPGCVVAALMLLVGTVQFVLGMKKGTSEIALIASGFFASTSLFGHLGAMRQYRF